MKGTIKIEKEETYHGCGLVGQDLGVKGNPKEQEYFGDGLKWKTKG